MVRGASTLGRFLWINGKNGGPMLECILLSSACWWAVFWMLHLPNPVDIDVSPALIALIATRPSALRQHPLLSYDLGGSADTAVPRSLCNTLSWGGDCFEFSSFVPEVRAISQLSFYFASSQLSLPLQSWSPHQTFWCHQSPGSVGLLPLWSCRRSLSWIRFSGLSSEGEVFPVATVYHWLFKRKEWGRRCQAPRHDRAFLDGKQSFLPSSRALLLGRWRDHSHPDQREEL